ncbi:MAG: hypothetical protein IJ778_03580 [Alphaproteobacteria bacterium]|nr:hypothetical protein [Alphaproteobacteria bacterium]
MWISKEKYEDIERRVRALNAELQRLYKLTFLVSIDTDGEDITFTFCREDKLITVKAKRVQPDEEGNLPSLLEYKDTEK